MLCVHYEISKDGFIYQSLLDLQSFEAFQGLYSSHILNHVFEFWLARKYFEPLWKNDQAKTGPARAVPPLLIFIFTINGTIPLTKLCKSAGMTIQHALFHRTHI